MDSINNACKFGSDAWLELQAFKTRQLNRREKLNRHKNLQNDLINGIALNQTNTCSNNHHLQQQNPLLNTTGSTPSAAAATQTSASHGGNNFSSSAVQQPASPLFALATNKSSTNELPDRGCEDGGGHKGNNLEFSISATAVQVVSHSNFITTTTAISTKSTSSDSSHLTQSTIENSSLSSSTSTTLNNSDSSFDRNYLNLDLVECLLLLKLCDVALKLPIDSKSLQCTINRIRGLENTTQPLVENLLQKFAHQELITIEEPAGLLNRRKNGIVSVTGGDNDDDESCIYVTSADHTKLVEFDKSIGSLDNIRALLLESKFDDQLGGLDDCDLAVSIQHNSVPIQNVRATLNDRGDDGQLENSRDLKQLTDDNDLSTVNNVSYLDRTTSFANAAAAITTSLSCHQRLASSSSTGVASGNSIKKQQAASNAASAAAAAATATVGDDVESLLSLSSTRERESKKLGEELLELLSKPTAKERNLLERFRSADGYQVQEFCPKGTKGECRRNNKGACACDKLHFKKIIAKHTEESLGDCSFLNTCFHMDSCKYVHYEVDYDEKPHQFKRPHPADPTGNNSSPSPSSATATNHHSKHQQRHKATDKTTTAEPAASDNFLGQSSSSLLSQLSLLGAKGSAGMAHSNKKNSNNNKPPQASSMISGELLTVAATTARFSLSAEEQARIDAKNRKRFKTVLYPPQWIQCDLRFFDMSLLGKFSVVMADPPWDIHMELPYGTMSDDEMRKLNIPALQDEGVIFLWVTGRAMELGRECLALWGYERCDEIIWVKTNQLQRIIRTGRTGHWLNHGKEHCLVGVKGNPKDINRGLDCDVIVAEVRATSHKPDEIYGIIERLSPGTRKIELFGRAHNVQPNWITLGNQLNGVRLIEPSLVNAFKKLNLPFQTADHVG